MFDFLFVPAIIISLLAICGGYLLPLGTYKLPLQLLGTVALALLLFFAGKSFESNIWEKKMAEANLKIQNLSTQAEKISTKIEIEYRDKIQYVDVIKKVPVTQFVTVKDDSDCKINKGFVDLYNASAQGVVPVPTNVEATTTVKLSDVAEVTKQNNAEYNLVSSRLTSLQDWVSAQQKNWNSK